MREIKFRAWDKKSERMFYSQDASGFDENTGREYFPFVFEIGYKGSRDIDLMQYTGLKDKNVKEIYEGDICQIHYYHDTSIPSPVGVVNWLNSMTGFSIVAHKNVDGEALTGCYSLNFKSGGEFGNTLAVEIIGNIYENPELLKP